MLQGNKSEGADRTFETQEKREDLFRPEMTSREASQEFLADERKTLAKEIKRERRESRDKLAELKIRTGLLEGELVSPSLEINGAQKRFFEIKGMRATVSNSFANRIGERLSGADDERSPNKTIGESKGDLPELSSGEEVLGEELQSLDSLIQGDESLKKIKEGIEEHYKKAGLLSQENVRERERTVEQTTLRNGVFLVHTIDLSVARHNENSIVSKEATTEDDINILLSLEPSISASSINPGTDEEGRTSGIWSPDSYGFLIGSGEIKGAEMSDAGTVSAGIKSRRMHPGAETTTEKIDEIAQKRRRDPGFNLGGYNEFVVDNPKVFGFFWHAHQDEKGVFWSRDLSTKKELESLHKDYSQKTMSQEELKAFKGNVERYRSKMNKMKEKGMPVYIMSQDGKFFEYIETKDSGSVVVGKELTPEEVARGKAGLSPENRRKIGEDVIGRAVFKGDKHREEAEAVVRGL